MTIRVVLCDDHPIVRDGLRNLLLTNNEFVLVGEAEDGATAVEMAKQLLPDVVIMDMTLPNLNGALATKQIKAACPNTNILALTAHHDKSYMLQFLEAGATGYILKKTVGSELLEAIRIVAAGEFYIDELMRQTSSKSQARWPRVTGTGITGVSPLSEREEQVVQSLAKGFTNKEIAKQLGVSVKTIETYKSRALEKLDLRSRAELVRYAVQKGWLTETIGSDE